MTGVRPYIGPFLIRFLVLSIVASGFILLVSEIGYRLLREESSRPPKTIELLIPAGTSEKIGRGESNPAIPKEMIFVVGDVLLVKNQDTVDHELGPVWIPAGTSASLTLDQANDFTYSCSFRESRYFDLTVRKAITWHDRLGALWYGVPPTVMFLLVYSFVIKPIKPAKHSGQSSEKENL
jgi:hypothetical protein